MSFLNEKKYKIIQNKSLAPPFLKVEKMEKVDKIEIVFMILYKS